jgi:hypothetical protein
LLESATVYTVLMVSLIVFVIAGWRLPQAFNRFAHQRMMQHM